VIRPETTDAYDIFPGKDGTGSIWQILAEKIVGPTAVLF